MIIFTYNVGIFIYLIKGEPSILHITSVPILCIILR